jgi:hypothetical protein
MAMVLLEHQRHHDDSTNVYMHTCSLSFPSVIRSMLN